MVSRTNSVLEIKRFKGCNCQPERLHVTSLCNLASLQYGSLRVIRLHTWQLGAPSTSVPVIKAKVTLPFMF